MSFPLGGMERQENDVSAVEVMNCIFDAFTLDAGLAGASLTKGTVLAFTVAGAGTTLQLYVPGAGDVTAEPVCMLGSDVTTPTPAGAMEITAIVSGQVNGTIGHTGAAGGTPLTVLDKARLRQTGIIPLSVTELTAQDN